MYSLNLGPICSHTFWTQHYAVAIKTVHWILRDGIMSLLVSFLRWHLNRLSHVFFRPAAPSWAMYCERRWVDLIVIGSRLCLCSTDGLLARAILYDQRTESSVIQMIMMLTQGIQVRKVRFAQRSKVMSPQNEVYHFHSILYCMSWPMQYGK